MSVDDQSTLTAPHTCAATLHIVAGASQECASGMHTLEAATNRQPRALTRVVTDACRVYGTEVSGQNEPVSMNICHGTVECRLAYI